ncbi:hypothetical protein ACFQU2_22035 [Siccirubricoccus deserti]
MDIPAGFIDAAKDLRFSRGAALQDFFRQRLGQDFPSWFNARVAGREEWKAKRIPPKGAAGFALAWDAFLALRPASLLEVLGYTAIFINETGGSFQPGSERFGHREHPGIAYLFDAFRITDASGHGFDKASYNTGPLGLSAGRLFRDPAFNRAHGGKPLGAKLAGTTDPVWDSVAYPQDRFPTTADPAVTGYVLEADFFNRGRGLIQTTWRAGYRPLVEFIQTYAGTQPVVAEYRARWAGLSPDAACTASSTLDWDRLFQASGMVVPCAALLAHAKTGGYLPLASDAATLNGSGTGSLLRMGRRISGSTSYGALLRARVARMVLAMAQALA